MKLVGVLFVMLVAAAWGAPQDTTYSTKYDNIDIDNILMNDRLLTQYINCILDQGPCTPDGRAFRNVLPDAIATTCGKCNASQKTLVRKAVNHMKTNRPQDWETIKQKYDPKGEHHSSFSAFLAGN